MSQIENTFLRVVVLAAVIISMVTFIAGYYVGRRKGLAANPIIHQWPGHAVEPGSCMCYTIEEPK